MMNDPILSTREISLKASFLTGKLARARCTNDLLTLTDDDLMAGGQPRPGRQETSTMPPPVRVHHGEKKHAKMKGPFGFCQVGFAKLVERGYLS
jgi:hypothetical protein